MKELYGLSVTSEEFVPFVGTGEANFLGGVARKYKAPFDADTTKRRFFEIYLEEATKPSCRIGYSGEPTFQKTLPTEAVPYTVAHIGASKLASV